MRHVPFQLRRAVATRVAVSTEHKYIYIRMPKAANSTISKTLAVHTFEDYERGVDLDEKGNVAKGLFQNWQQSGCYSIDCMVENYFIFSFFRNPYSRILSAYLDKVSRSGKKFHQLVARRIGHKEHYSFEDFVLYLENGGIRDNAHWARQTEITPVPVSRLDFIGRIETLDKDMAYILREVFNIDEYDGLKVRQNDRRGSDKILTTYYNDDLRERIYTLYKKDFEQIGYSR